jgi:cyclomaltodextrinase / maltogenic alpha-amylase / neopullulanase
MFIAALLGLSIVQSARDVEFVYQSPKRLESVCIVGEFNEWDRARFLLKPDGEGKKWRGTFKVEPGAYNYLVCENNKRWLPDPSRKLVRDTNGNPLTRLIVFPADFDKHSGKLGDGDITASAFLHRPDGQDTARLSEHRYYLRFRTRANDVQKVGASVDGHWVKFTRRRSDELYDYWQGEFETQNRVIEYSFELQDGNIKLSFNGPHPKFVQMVDDYPRPSPPSWVKSAVFYQIFPDRFENGDRGNDPSDVAPWGSVPTATNRMGGDLKGIEKRLPYLKNLGINALYLNPIFESLSNHGYDTVDYLKIDPRFGTKEDLKRLVSKAHGLGIRVILDAVFNHTSPEFFAFKDLREKGANSQYVNWYFPIAFPIEVKEGQKTYRTFAGVPTMPKLNTVYFEAGNYLCDVGAYWIQQCNIDGWRLDVADEVSPDFWRRFRSEIKAVKPDAYILGEVWGDAHTYLQGDQHDGVMNYRWRRAVQEWLLDPKASNDSLCKNLDQIRSDYPDAVQTSLFNVLSSHDTERLATRFKGNESSIRIATALQFFYPGVPCIYYGDEIGMEGGHDPLCRGAMVWEKGRRNEERLGWFKLLAKLRKTRPSLTSSQPVKFVADKSCLVMSRSSGKELTTLYVNRSKKVQSRPGGELLAGFKAKVVGGKVILESGGVALIGR